MNTTDKAKHLVELAKKQSLQNHTYGFLDIDPTTVTEICEVLIRYENELKRADDQIRKDVARIQELERDLMCYKSYVKAGVK